MIKNNPAFKSNLIKRMGAKIILDKFEKMTSEQQVSFWQKQTEAMRKQQQSLRRKNLSTGPLPPDSHQPTYSKKSKTAACLEIKDKAAEKILKIINSMTLKEQLAYWQKGTEKLRQKQQAFRRDKNMLSGR